MSQATNVIGNGTGLAVRTAMNAALAAINSGHSGTVIPVYAAAGMLYWRTDIPGAGIWTLYAYDGSDGCPIGTLDTTSHAFAFGADMFDNALGSTKGMIAKRGASQWAGLAVGSAWQGLRINAAGDDLEYGDQWQKLAADIAATSVSSVSFTGIPSGINDIEIVVRILIPSSNGVNARVTLYDASGVEITTSIYSAAYGNSTNTGTGQGGAANTTFSEMPGGGIISNNSAFGGVTGKLRLTGLQYPADKRGTYNLFIRGTDSVPRAYFGGIIAATSSVVTGVKFAFSAGNIGFANLSIFGAR